MLKRMLYLCVLPCTRKSFEPFDDSVSKACCQIVFQKNRFETTLSRELHQRKPAGQGLLCFCGCCMKKTTSLMAQLNWFMVPEGTLSDPSLSQLRHLPRGCTEQSVPRPFTLLAGLSSLKWQARDFYFLANHAWLLEDFLIHTYEPHPQKLSTLAVSALPYCCFCFNFLIYSFHPDSARSSLLM